MNSSYSASKALWHGDRLEQLRHGKSPAPVHVQLILSDLCNQDCGFCAYRISDGLSSELFSVDGDHNPNRRIETRKAREIIDDCAQMGVRAIQFTGGGEPTVHPDYLDLIGHAQSYGIDTGLVTNGVKLSATNRATLALKWIRVSVDAGTAESYARVRRVSPHHWKRAWATIGELSENYKGRLSVGFVVTNENHKELPAFVEKCVSAGVGSARVGAVFSERGASYYEDLEDVEASIKMAESRAESLGLDLVVLFGRRLQELRHGSPRDSFCGYQYMTVYIGADLGVYRCCNTAYTTRGKVGNLSAQTFASLMSSRIVADGFDARGCHFCQFLSQNAAISSAVTEPDDASFV